MKKIHIPVTGTAIFDHLIRRQIKNKLIRKDLKKKDYRLCKEIQKNIFFSTKLHDYFFL